MKIAVTGPRGFVAKHLIAHLKGEKHQVVTIDRGMSGAKLKSFFETERPEVVVHLATQFLKTHTDSDIHLLFESNVTFTTELLEYSSQTSVKHFIGFGSFYQFPIPASLYAATKAAVEPIYDFYAAQKKLSITELYLYDSYGPNDPREKILNLLMKAAKSGEELLLSPGEQQMKLVHVDDIVSATVKTIESGGGAKSTPQRFSVEPLEAPTLKGLVQCVERVAEKKINARWGAKPYTPGVQMKPELPYPPLPGWKAQKTLAQALVDLMKA